jgi:signal transduction histidine kinase
MTRSRQELLADAALAGILAAAGVVGTLGAGERFGNGGLPTGFPDAKVDALALGLVLTAALALVARRRLPRLTLAVVTLATSAYLVLQYPYGPILLSFLVAVYTVARHLPIRPAATATAAALPLLLLHVLIDGGPGLPGLVPGSAWAVVPFAVGSTLRLSRENAERTRAELARQYADAERLRVAQEVHDVVGHGLSAITMQAEIALHLLPSRPEQAGVALAAISRTSREALDELRVTLGVVRGAESRAPMPGLARLSDLAARISDSGVPVKIETTGQPRALPAPADLAAYRVVQEALTNVLCHAKTASAVVRLGYEPGVVTVRVTDTGPVPPAGQMGEIVEGHGLAGMRERVTALGGTVSAGRHGNGFRVTASLPAP